MCDANTLEGLIGKAILAPSSHNSQPWIFEVGQDRIRLHADRTRALPVNDPDDRELVISCGCALKNLRVAAAKEKLGAVVTPFPDGEDADVLADISFEGTADDALADLADAIPERRTYRKRFRARDIPAAIQESLIYSVQAEGAWLAPLADADTRNRAASLVAEGDALQWSDPRWRRELAQWMHPRRSGDGLTVPWLALPLARLVVRSFDMGNGVGAKDGELAEHSPLLAVLGTQGDGPADWLRAGQALERMLLTSVGFGLQASYLNQPVEVPPLRPKLTELCGVKGFPQILIRLGYPEEELPAAPRRPVSEVVDR